MSVHQSILIPEPELPRELSAELAVEAAYAEPLAEVASRLARGLPVLVECDKELSPYAFANLRGRLKPAGLQCLYLDGRPRAAPDPSAGASACGFVANMLNQLRDAVRGAVERRVVVLPHLDLLTTGQGGLTAEAREVIPLLYENPELVWLGFKDPSFPLPRVIENLFPHRASLLGIPRGRLRHLVTQKEARKFGRRFNPWGLYKYVSGVNAVRLRRLLSTLEGEDYPDDPKYAYRQLRQATLVGTLEVPEIDLDRDIGGYDQREGAAAGRDPRRARPQGPRDRRRGGVAARGADPPGDDLLGPAGHGQDPVRQGHGRGPGGGGDGRLRARAEEPLGRRERGEPPPDLPHAPGSRPRRSSSSTSSTRSPPPAACTPAPASSTRWSTSS